MRLDKFLATVGLGSRKEVKGLIKKGQIKVNEKEIKSDKFQVNEWTDIVSYEGERLFHQKDFYYILNKPAGVISATQDNYEQTVLDLFDESSYREDLFPVGRLDKDTEGLLLITNDGALAHRLLSPKHHVDKCYFAKIRGIVDESDRDSFKKGVNIGTPENEEWTMPGELEILKTDERSGMSDIRLTIQEGKYHQVKRMFLARGKEVVYLKRERMGNLILDEKLCPGEHRKLTDEEIKNL